MLMGLEVVTMTTRSAAYKVLRVSNDIRAVRHGKVTRRIARRAYGKATGRLARKLFR